MRTETALNGHAGETGISPDRAKTGSNEVVAKRVQTNGAVEDDSAILTPNESMKKEKKERKKKKRKAQDIESHETPQLENREPKSSESTNYVQDEELTSLSNKGVQEYLSSNFISITGPRSDELRSVSRFNYLPPDSRYPFIFKGFDKPTPVQAAAWPWLLAGRDVIGIAETGSGKTLAFGIPCVRHLKSKGRKKQSKIRAVIVSPTRELALQIHEQMGKLVADTDVKVVCIYGGVPKDPQRTALTSSHIVIATPGRLMDFIQEGSADLSHVSFFILDEADRMLEKGFEQDMKTIAATMPTGKVQTAMFTATWPLSIRELAEQFMKEPVKIAIGDNPDGELRANIKVTQQVEVVDPRDKEQRLLKLLKQYQSGKQKTDRILVFCLYKKEASRIEGFIRSRGLSVAGIHGDLSQEARTKALTNFRNGSVPLLVATDVAARGLDIPAVKVVINVTCKLFSSDVQPRKQLMTSAVPLTAEDYVHRIGRTGRAGQDGLAITLFTEHDKALSGALINVLRAAKQTVPAELLKFGGTVKKKQHEAYGSFYKDTGSDKKATRITF